VPAPEKILFVTPEIYPLVKTGGLADISGALPLALLKLGLDVRVLVPGYPPILDQLPDAKPLADVSALAGESGRARVLRATMPGSDLPLLVLDCPMLFARPGGPYLSPDGRDWEDNALRFGLLCRVGALLASAGSPLAWKPDVVHCNDWQSGLIPALLHYAGKPCAKTVMSIHNLMFQGNFGREWVTHAGLPASAYGVEGVEFYGHFSFLKAGLYFADQITTVSRTYAEEIQTPEFGYGMDGLLRWRRAALHGIVNGIGDDWHPATDSYLHARYDSASLQQKALNKRALQREMKLREDPGAPLLCTVSRLTRQKGIDLLLDCVPDLLQAGVQFAVLGSGEKPYEERLRGLVRRNPGRVGASLGHNEGLAHRLIAGGDIFLMPSRFEPCGLAQMYAMTYGTPAVARRTGGLADTIVDTNEAALHDGVATGFLFDGQSSSSLMHAVRRALACFRDKAAWHSVQENGMRCDFSWNSAARAYLEVYRRALEPPAPVPDVPVPEARAPEARAPEARAPEARAPEARAPEARAPEAQAPEANLAEASIPEANIPEAGVPPSQAATPKPAGRKPSKPALTRK
jgi:starch synthase